MIHKKGLRSGRKTYFEEDTVNPMEGVANLVDAMLVLACGLMMAVIMFYNVDLQSSRVEITDEEMQEVEDIAVVDEAGNIVGGYESMGKVYQDPETGKIYIVTPDGSSIQKKLEEQKQRQE